MKTKAISATAYAPIRKSPDFGGKEFICISEIEPTMNLCLIETKKTGIEIPGWHKANPVQRIVEVTITETRKDEN